MTGSLADSPYVMERGACVFFVESFKKGRRRIINLNKLEYLEFSTTKLYDDSGEIFTAKLQYEGARCHVFDGADASILYDYYIGSAELIYETANYQTETKLDYD